MRDIIYLIINRKSVMEMRKRPPTTLSSGEHCVKVIIEVPDKVFVKCIPVVNIELPEPDELTLSDIETEVSWR